VRGQARGNCQGNERKPGLVERPAKNR